jgi:DNA repair protein SbcD/Mre11
MTLTLVHTADWHLGDRLGNQDRQADQFARLEELMAHVDRHAADVLLIAGDVLDEFHSDALSRIIGRLANLLAPRVAAGLDVVFLAGNHDREYIFPLLAGVQELVGGDGAGGTVEFISRPGLLALSARDGTQATLLALPFPTPTRYDLAGERFPSVDAKRKSLGDAVRERMGELATDAARDRPELPVIVLGHFLMRGVEARTGARELSESEDVVIERGDLPTFAYIALGHVHKPQIVEPHVRYCGSIERMDLGEANDQKHALLVTLEGAKLTGITELPLDATPFASLEVGSLQELHEQADMLAEPERTLVALTMRVGRDDDLGAWMAAAHERFPRLYDHPRVIHLDDPLLSQTEAGYDHRKVGDTVREYLRAEIPEEDPDRDTLLALADELLSEQTMEPSR